MVKYKVSSGQQNFLKADIILFNVVVLIQHDTSNTSKEFAFIVRRALINQIWFRMF